MPIKTEVRTCRGAPTLFLDGEPQTGLMHWHSKPDTAAADMRLLADSGIDLFTGPFGLPWSRDGHPDFAGTDRRMSTLLAANPRLLVMPRFGLDPPPWWLEEHPGELMVHHNLDTGRTQRGPQVAITSRPWRQAAGATLAAWVEHMESAWGDRVFAYHPGSGDCGEHSYAWGFPERLMSDYSAPQLQAFREWLEARYAGDVERLRQAWKEPRVEFATAAVPLPVLRGRSRTELSLHDPAAGRQVIDYITFHSEAMADAVLFACGSVKSVLRRLGREKICGAFYAYHHWGVGEPQLLFNSGHHAHRRVLESADVDFLCAPNYYPNRHSGGAYASQLLTASLRLHGKLFYAEDDTGTHLAHEGWWGFVCRDAAMSASLLRRNFLGVWQEGGTLWWMDWAGAGWYRDAAIQHEFSFIREFAGKSLARGRESLAQTAVFASDESVACMRQDAGLKDALLDRQLEELTALGAPFDLYRVGDLERLLDTPKVRDYRFVLFLDTLSITPQERRLIRDRLACDGRTLLWSYAPGLVQEDGWSVENVAELTGMQLRLDRRLRPSLLVETWLTGQRLAYGMTSAAGPSLVGADPDARIAGLKLDSTHCACPERGDEPGLLIKELPGWRSVWSAAPAMPSVLLQHFAREAGVHLYVERGDQVFAGPGWLGLHARLDGEVLVRLPQAAAEVRDARSGALCASGTDTFRVQVRRGETYLWTY